MYFVSTKRMRPARRGVILLVVLLLLTIFATLGLTLVLMTESYANSSRISREAENLARADADPELAFALFMGQFIYDVDDTTGPNSALRGYSLARSMYSWDSGLGTLCDKPYSGWGRLRNATTSIPGLNEFNAVNYQQFGPNGSPMHDPERMGSGPGGWRTAGGKVGAYVGGFNVPYTYVDENNMFLGYVKQTATGSTVVIPSYHRPWLMPQANWLASSQAGKYQTLRPRSVDMGPGFPTDAEVDNSGNPNPVYDVKNLDGFPGGADSVWIDIGAPIMTTPDGVKYKMLFAPLVLELDSRINLNAHGNVGANNGTTHASNQGWGPWEVNIAKILGAGEAQSIFDGSQNQQGNMPHVPGRYTNPTDRFPKGPALQGPTGGRIWAAVDYDAKINANAGVGGVTNAVVPVPEAPFSAYWHSAIPFFSVDSIYRNGVALETTTTGKANGIPNHPAVYNPQRPAPGNQNIPLLSQIELLRFNGTNFEALQSSLMQMAPGTMLSPVSATIAGASEATNPMTGVNTVTITTTAAHGFSAGQNVTITNVGNVVDAYNGRYTITGVPSATSFTYTHPKAGMGGMAGGIATNLARQQLTLISTDLGRPAAMPYVWDPNPAPAGSGTYQYTMTVPTTGATAGVGQPSGQSNTFPTATQLANPVKPTNSEFLPSVARALKVDLNRYLTPYYTVNPLTGKAAFSTANYKQATTDRQNFATDIFSALRVATGARNPNDTTIKMSTAELDAARYLAQLAVNIVDYIDQDDFNTPFEWLNNIHYTPAQQWVFGIELPRLVINEVYAQLDNDKNDGSAKAPPQNYYQNVWVELFNPLRPETDSSLNGNPQDVSAQLTIGTTNAYRLLVTQQQMVAADRQTLLDYMRKPSNPDGPDVAAQPPPPPAGPPWAVGTPWQKQTNFDTMFSTVSGADFPTQTVDPLGIPTASNDPNQKNTGFLVIGSNFTNFITGENPFTNPPQNLPPPIYQGSKGTAKLQNQVPAATVDSNKTGVQPVTLVLQRLACPQMPYHSNPATATAKKPYNPYITVDFLSNIPVFDARHFTTTPTNNTNKNPQGGVNTNQPKPLNTRQSYGKRQPYSSQVYVTGASPPVIDVGAPPNYSAASPVNSQVALQTTPPLAPPKTLPAQIQHTFYAHNSLEGTTAFPPNPQPPPTPLPCNQKNQGTGGTLTQTLGRLVNASAPVPTNPANPALANISVQFDWLVHLDRQLISPMELLHVSAYKPTMLTQQFVTSSGGVSQAHQQVAPWLDQNTRLYRFFEFVETSPRTNGLAHSGRLPGKININMVFEPEILDAALDAQMGNFFTQAQVEAIHTALLVSRNGYQPTPTNPNHIFQPNFTNPNPLPNPPPQGPNTTAAKTPAGVLIPGGSNGDRPFWSFGVGPLTPPAIPPFAGDGLSSNQSPAGITARGIENTLLRSIGYNTAAGPSNLRLFDPNGIPIAYTNGATEASTTVTITTLVPHNLLAGQSVMISGVGVAGYNGGPFQVKSPVSATSFTYTSTSPGLSASGGGVATAMTGIAGNPRVRYELLNKMFNNVTTRSNTFAVWVTVGFFELGKDVNGNYNGDQFTPPKLGAEVGKAEGRNIRHRMFSIVDRTNLQLFNSTSVVPITIPTKPNPPPTDVVGVVALGPINSTLTPTPTLQNNMTLVYDPGTANEETVAVTQNPRTKAFTATFYKNHLAGCPVICRGNPGPQPNYYPRLDTDVVRYFAVIE